VYVGGSGKWAFWLYVGGSGINESWLYDGFPVVCCGSTDGSGRGLLK
jgi:hypothetical protein